ncbi:MAG: hypothetical protein KUG61_04950 [Parvibaculaceae bacterium]|nr:hypothetical protein [Parvibaculaceae bacterium]
MKIASACILLIIVLGGEWNASYCGYGFWRITMIDSIQLEWYNGNVYFENDYRLFVLMGGDTKIPLSNTSGVVRVENILEYTYDDERIYFVFEDKTKALYLGDMQRVLMSEEELSRYPPQMEEVYKFPLSAVPISEAKPVYDSHNWIGLRSIDCWSVTMGRFLLLVVFLFFFGKLLLIGFRKLQIQ